MKSITKRLRTELFSHLEGLFRFIPGTTGRLVRRLYYMNRLRQCGRNLIVDIGVNIIGPEFIEIGDDVWIGAYTYIESSFGIDLTDRIDNRKPEKVGCGGLTIGNGVSIGAWNIIAAQNEIVIENYSTTSARVSLYSISHDYIDRRDRSHVVAANIMASKYLDVAMNGAPIRIGNNCWIGLNSSVFGGIIADNSVIGAHTLIYSDIGPCSVVTTNMQHKFKQRFC
jgi:acetyltransferase-like isoleucine patch superfamily enzyme